MKWLLVALLFLCPPEIGATPLEKIPDPRASHWICDTADILDVAGKTRIQERFALLYQRRHFELALVTVKDSNGESPKAYADEIRVRWALGESNGSGAVMVVYKNDRRIEVSLNHGVAQVLTEAKILQILQIRVIP